MMFTLDYLELPSTDAQASAAFFAAAFGWGEIDYGPDYRGLADAGIDLGIDGSETRTAAVLPVIRATDLDAAEAAVRRAGGTITRAQFDFPGGRRFHARVPGGIEIAVWIERAA